MLSKRSENSVSEFGSILETVLSHRLPFREWRCVCERENDYFSRVLPFLRLFSPLLQSLKIYSVSNYPHYQWKVRIPNHKYVIMSRGRVHLLRIFNNFYLSVAGTCQGSQTLIELFGHRVHSLLCGSNCTIESIPIFSKSACKFFLVISLNDQKYRFHFNNIECTLITGFLFQRYIQYA